MRKITAIFLFSGLSLLISGCTGQEKSITLRLRFEPGEKLTFHQSTKGHIRTYVGDSLAGDRQENWTADYVQEVVSIEPDSIAELPVQAAAPNLVTAIREFPMRAAMMTFLDEEAMAVVLSLFQSMSGGRRPRGSSDFILPLTKAKSLQSLANAMSTVGASLLAIAIAWRRIASKLAPTGVVRLSPWRFWFA